ncbi:MAG TPA: antibiotic biosynthesis monooxygenase [Fimbriimonas sp.]|nr:antibiotic biosynthesis monooxygenase [Fimbriimonas sp.]
MKPLFPALALSCVLGLAVGLSVNNASAQQKPQSTRDFPDLVGGLKASPGCLGVEVVTAKGGKQAVIMAWFKNKKAVEDWYYSPMHTGAMSKFFPGQASGHKPLELVKDPNIPIMVIASVTPSEKPAEGQSLAVSQIAIELYTPLPGGAALGSTFAPESLNTPGLTRLKG